MFSRIIHATPLALGVLILVSTGCFGGSDPEPRFQQIGDAKKSIVERQRQNPERSEALTPVEGQGATTTADVVSNYHKNQQTEAQQDRQERQRDNGLVDVDN